MKAKITLFLIIMVAISIQIAIPALILSQNWGMDLRDALLVGLILAFIVNQARHDMLVYNQAETIRDLSNSTVKFGTNLGKLIGICTDAFKEYDDVISKENPSSGRRPNGPGTVSALRCLRKDGDPGQSE